MKSFAARILAVFTFGLCSFASAGVWDNPTNLQVLPSDISPQELRSTMKGFALATGSRCSTCHVAEDPADVSTYDHSKDDKEQKRKARAMIRMTMSINEYLAENLGVPDEDRITVECATCHRGQRRPEMIENIMVSKYRNEGFDAARTEYRNLRDSYYGGYAFDFSDEALNQLAERLLSEQDLDGALAFLDLNIEFNPTSVRPLQIRGDVLRRKGDIAGARASYVKALEIDPDNRWTQALLDRLDSAAR